MSEVFKHIDWSHDLTRSIALGHLKEKWQAEAYEDAELILLRMRDKCQKASDHWKAYDAAAAAIRSRSTQGEG